MRRQAARPGLDAGFTLVELMGVLLILGLIVSVVYISYESMVPKAQLHRAVRELGARIQGTRSDAIARSAPFDILYDLDGDLQRGPAYAVVSPFKIGGGLIQLSGNPETEQDEVEDRIQFDWVEMPDTVLLSQVVVDGIVYDNGVIPIRFDPLGTSSAHSIVLEQPQYDAFFTIEVLGLTGLIRFHEGIVIREPPEDTDFE